MQNGRWFELRFCVKIKMRANTSSDYTDINITVAMMTEASFEKLQVCLIYHKHFAVISAFE